MAFTAGLLAAFSLMWQQQATLASFVDPEHGAGTFSADTLEAITPDLAPGYGKVSATWTGTTGDWATPQYTLDWSATTGGLGSAQLYSGTGTSASLTTGPGTQSSQSWLFTDVAAGTTHACGIAHGSVYCWGTSAAGGLGLGATTTSSVPMLVGGVLGAQQVLELSAGKNFTCARTSTGTAYCWGEGSNGQLGNGGTSDSSTPQTVTGISDVSSISAGGTHACAVSGGKAYCWGLNSGYQVGDGSNTQRSTPAAVSVAGVLAGRTVSSVSAGTVHSCAVADGRAFCWGNNGNGRLGNNSITNATTPVAVYVAGVLLGRTVTAVSAGDSHSCAVADGTAFCWGLNTSGRLGNSSTTQSTIPVAVTTTVMSATVTAISAGYNHSCAVAAGGVYCWGDGTYTQLGNGSGSSTSPVHSTGTLTSRTATTVSTGTSFTCATGYTPAACWGLGTSGQLGNSGTVTKSTPVDVVLTGAACPDGSVLVGTGCSLTEGTSYYFRLGYSIGSWTAPSSDWVKTTTKTRGGVDPTLDTNTSTSISAKWAAPSEPGDSYPEYTLQRSTSSDGSSPQTVAVVRVQAAQDRGGLATPEKFSKLTSGLYHSCGIVDGALYCWGYNNYGQLGLGNYTNASEPTKVTAFNGKTVTDVSAGDNHTCAVADTVAYCWGYNNRGQLGTGNTTTLTTPTAVSGQTGLTVLSIAAGTGHTCEITQGGYVWCWGYNNRGQLGLGNTSGGTANYYPQAVLAGDMGTGVATTIKTGSYHTCAIANSRAYCWGYNNYGQVGATGTTLTSPKAVDTSYDMGAKTVTALTIGANHSCAIADSKAYCWGWDNYGQIGNSAVVVPVMYATSAVTATTMSGTVTALSAGANHTCAVAGGKAFCWGYGTSGQLGNSASASQTAPVRVPASGGLQSDTVSLVTGGSQHSCATFDDHLYCWGLGTYGRLANRDTATTYNYPQAVPVDVLCGGGTAIGDGTCSLAPGTTYYYRVKYTLDAGPTKTGSWVGLSTSG
jgi:alpha-tubulin suppressor-like RCC1 family protein